MKKQSPTDTPFKQILSRLPAEAASKIHRQLHSIINYEPRIGLLGKTGSGKSSLCNTLFAPPPAIVDAVKGCTRRVQRWHVSHNNRTLHIVDFPGIAENPELDVLYQRIYRSWSSKLDVIVWVLKADERAWNDDIRCYRSLIEAGIAPSRFVFVLSQADKIEPCREWDNEHHQPSDRQVIHIHAKAELVRTQFTAVHPVIAVSATENFNLERWVEVLIEALPLKSASAFISHLDPEFRSQRVHKTAREGFIRASGDIFDDAVSVIQTSGKLIRQLHHLRQRFLSVIRAIWHLLF
jgi:predicted GTPase